jgi:hypothetical protein
MPVPTDASRLFRRRPKATFSIRIPAVSTWFNRRLNGEWFDTRHDTWLQPVRSAQVNRTFLAGSRLSVAWFDAARHQGRVCKGGDHFDTGCTGGSNG